MLNHFNCAILSATCHPITLPLFDMVGFVYEYGMQQPHCVKYAQCYVVILVKLIEMNAYRMRAKLK